MTDRPTDRPDGFRVEVIPTFSLGRDLGLFTAVHPEDLLGETRAQVVICCYLLRLLSSSVFVHFFHPKQTPSEKGGDSRLGSILVETKLRSRLTLKCATRLSFGRNRGFLLYSFSVTRLLRRRFGWRRLRLRPLSRRWTFGFVGFGCRSCPCLSFSLRLSPERHLLIQCPFYIKRSRSWKMSKYAAKMGLRPMHAANNTEIV